MYQNLLNGWMKHWDFTILDCISLEIAFFIAYVIRNGFPRNGFSEEYNNMIWAIIMLNICAVFFLNSYKEIIRRGLLVELKQTLIQCAFVIVGLIVWMFVLKESSTYSRQVVITMYPISVGITYFIRVAWKTVVQRWILGRKELREILVFTTKDRAEAILDALILPFKDYKINGCILYDTNEMIGNRIRKIPVVTDKNHIIEYIQENVVDEVFVDVSEKDKDVDQLLNILVNMGVVVHVNLMKYNPRMENKRIEKIGGMIVLSSGMKFVEQRDLFFKRLLDICGALIGIIFTIIAYVVFAPIIKKQSPGPALFSQERVGRNGRRFKIYKFRTMYMDAEERKKELMAQNKMDGFMFKIDNDPRIIPIGHFLRKTSIDEFPQFWNVLKGDMSLVGTRPPTVDEYEKYETRHHKRLAMKPGLTGMWQISGRSDITDFEEIVALDAKYITEWDLSLDIKILWKTVMTVLLRRGAV